MFFLGKKSIVIVLLKKQKNILFLVYFPQYSYLILRNQPLTDASLFFC